MEVQVLFFGATADAVGKRKVSLSVNDTTSVSEACQNVLEEFPSLCEKNLLFALNQEYASGTEYLSDGDELAIFTAVSGG